MRINLEEFAWLIDNKLPPGLTFEGVYLPEFVGDTKVIAKDEDGRVYSFVITTTSDGLLTLEFDLV